MKVFCHHIYEYKKGIRNLILHTLPARHEAEATRKLEMNGIAYIVQHVTAEKINIFFGAEECVDVIKQFGDTKLYDFTPEQDFILGIMLGYGHLQQCARYLGKVEACKLKKAAS